MHTMSESSSSGIGNPCVGVRERSDASSSPDRSARQRVLKEVGLTSTTFIGPSFPQKTTTVQPDIEESLSEFYKELERIDTPDDANDNPEKQDAGFVRPPVPETSACKDTQDAREEKIGKYTETDGYQKSSRQKQPSWPHWYQNEPYYPRRPRPGMDLNSGEAAPPPNRRHYPQPPSRPPNPRFDRPPFHHPPPPHAFPHSQSPPPHMNHNWSGPGMTDQYQPESHFPTFSNFPPPNVCSHRSQGFYGDSPHHFDRDERGGNHDAYSDNRNAEWSRDRKEEWCQSGEDYDRCQRYDSESEVWERHCQPCENDNAWHSSLVLILMRGLPGSGKSTMARELLSTGPSGLILSTDDYFAHRDGYRYDPGLLGAAHEWNQSRAKDAMHDGRSPIIIDNTNIQVWEMKPYVKMALDRGYKVDFCEPDTSWKFDPYELEKRNKHGVPQEKIAQMMDRFSFPVSIDIVMNSQEPLHVNQRRRLEQPQMMNRKY
ncbi:uncharacterized protein n4bp2l2 [Chaetodon auriga]|uniref:uncharacterized protein n4bp2l2 n=1 Tax=Chaetodon auriga TaxID=39042 RepID=UPI004032AB70